MMHELKIERRFAYAVFDGRKSFDVRRNDRGFNAGDRVRFTVVEQDAATCEDHPLNGEVYRITYVLSGWGLKEGYVAFAIAPDHGSWKR